MASRDDPQEDSRDVEEEEGDEDQNKSPEIAKKPKKKRNKKKKQTSVETSVVDPSQKQVKDLKEILAKLSTAEETDKGTHLFWDTQPVPKLGLRKIL